MSDNELDPTDAPLLEDPDAPSITSPSKKKKKKTQKEEPKEELAQIDGPGPAEQKETKDTYATNRTWHKYPVFQCPSCAFDSLERERVAVHVARVHTLSEPPKRETQLYDRFNNPLTVQDEKE